MKKRIFLSIFLLSLIVATSVAQAQSEGESQASSADTSEQDPLGADAAVGTSFTYPGQLKETGGNPVDDTCDFVFSLWNSLSGVSQVGSNSTASGVSVSGGYFTAQVNASGEFGSTAFAGDARWLAISLRCPSGSGDYTTLSPRQALTIAPYANYALKAPWSGLTGVPSGFADGTDNDTTYAAGTGLSLSGSTFSVTGAPWSGLTGVPAGFADGVDNDTTYTAGTGLRLSSGEFSLLTNYALPQTCSNGQHPTWTALTSRWGCGTDDNTTYTAGSGLALNGTEFSVTGAPWSGLTGVPAGFADGVDDTGSDWHLTGNNGTNPTTNFIGTMDNQALVFKVNNLQILRLEPNTTSPNVIAGKDNNSVTAGVHGATIGGGGGVSAPNLVSDDYGTIGGGTGNEVSGSFSTVGGGKDNTASANGTTVAGGCGNNASASGAVVGGGGCFDGGYTGNNATGVGSTVSGGIGNQANGYAAAVGGGRSNWVDGDYSFAVGYHARNTNDAHDGVFLFADSSNAEFSSAAANEFAVRASGGVRLRTSSDLSTGCNLAAGSGTWACTSDRNAKANFAAVDSRAILAQVAALPITTWNFKTQDASIQHIGPMAQDFYAAFGTGESDTTISMVDADGVALAAIQGLNEIVEEKDAQIAAMEARLSALEQAQPSGSTGGSNGSGMNLAVVAIGVLLVVVVLQSIFLWRLVVPRLSRRVEQ